MARKKGLGRGLDALLESNNVQLEESREKVFDIELNDISPQANQPRKHFDPDSLEELAASIKENGIIQPLILHKRGPHDYIIVAGERRWRAARMAGLETVPALVRNLDEETRLRQALIENIQRENLNPIEEARAYQLLLDNGKMTQEELADQLGKSRPTIANTLRLTKLSPKVQEMLINGRLSQGQARPLLAFNDFDDQEKIAQTVLDRKLNVRQIESYIRLYQGQQAASDKREDKEDLQHKISVASVEKQLSRSLGAKVKLLDRKGKGKIEIPYKNLDELDRLIALLCPEFDK